MCLMMNGALSSYLKCIDERCNHIVNITVREMAKENNVNEELKRTEQLKWVGLMNNFKSSAEEIVFNEIEDAVGARMLYALTDIDILEEYCEYIKTEIKLGRGLRDRI